MKKAMRLLFFVFSCVLAMTIIMLLNTPEIIVRGISLVFGFSIVGYYNVLKNK